MHITQGGHLLDGLFWAEGSAPPPSFFPLWSLEGLAFPDNFFCMGMGSLGAGLEPLGHRDLSSGASGGGLVVDLGCSSGDGAMGG